MELRNRSDIEDEFLAAVLLLWGSQRERFEQGPDAEFWEKKEDDDRALLLYWLAAVFVASARQHGLDQRTAEQMVQIWGVTHVIRVLSQMKRHTQRLLQGKRPAETIFGEARAQRMVITEVTAGQAAGGEVAKQLQGEWGTEDLWFAANPVERRCPYCGKLHLQPRRLWKEIYYTKILPANPELAIYGEPERTGIHPNCNCFILYRGESSDDN